MAIKKILGKGLEIQLDEFVKLRAFQAGGEFWGHENQSVIREHLEEFLPRMEVQSDGRSVLAQMFVNGKEVTSTSNPATRGVPKGEKKKLERAVARLKEKAADGRADQTTKSIIEAFRLPDPNKDSELYRIYGSRFKPRLLVLWGCEREPGSSIVPDEVPAKIKEESGGSRLVRQSPWLLLVLLLGLGYFLLQQGPFENPIGLAATGSDREGVLGESGDMESRDDPDNGPWKGGAGVGGTKDGGNTVDIASGVTPSGGDSTKSASGPGKEEDSPDDALSKRGGGMPGEKISGGKVTNQATNSDNDSEPGNRMPSNGDSADPGEDAGKATDPPLVAGNEPRLAEGTPLERGNPADGPLAVDEGSLDAAHPEITKQKPAEADLVNLAKITRSAVVLIVVSDENQKVRGSGSGFLISPDGIIVTNHHVLQGAAGALVKLANRSVFEVQEVIAADKERDLAVFRIDPKGEALPFLSLHEGNGAEVGENIAVIGSPLGLEGTFTIGIVSSTRKRGDVDFIQITAPISPGSSGSPVVNYDGSVVGVAVGAIEEGQSLNFAASVSELRGLLANRSLDSDLLSGSERPLNERQPESLPPGSENGVGVISAAPPSEEEEEVFVVGAERELPKIPASSEQVVASPGGGSPKAPATNVPKSLGSEPTFAPGDSTSEGRSFRIAQVSKENLPDGRVEVTLELRNDQGAAADIDKVEWRLDDTDASVAGVAGPRVTRKIEPGQHSLSVTGMTKSGEEINIHATLNIKVEVSSAVEIRQLGDR